MNINKEKINSLKGVNEKYCYITFTSQLLTNWVFLNLNTSFVDKCLFKEKKIYFNRYELLNKISLNFKVYLWFSDENFQNTIKKRDELKHFIFEIFNILHNENILERNDVSVIINKKINFKKNNNENKILKKKKRQTQIFFSLVDFKINIENNKIEFNIFKNKPNIKIINKTYFLGGLHYSTFFKVFKKNFKSNKTFNLANKELINKICSIEYQIDFSFYDKIANLICKNLNINYTDESINNYITNTLLSDPKGVYNEDLFGSENKQSIEEIENEKKIFQKKLSKVLEHCLFFEIKKNLYNVKKFYLGIDFDFRGRIYPKSCISPTGSKMIRYLYFYGYYNEKELNQFILKDFNEETENIIKNCIIFKIFDKINLNIKINMYYAYWCIFEIGKIFKNELSFKKGGFFNDIDLLKHSCEIINNIFIGSRKLSFDEELDYIYILSALEDLNKNLYKKLIVYKDATASGIQLLTIVHGSNNEEILKHCNLRSYDLWYDTYTYIINIFINKNLDKLRKITKDDYLPFLKRSDLKKSIMTYVYGAGIEKALLYYIENLPKKLDEKIGIEIFTLFYKFLKKFFTSNDFFKISMKYIKKKAELEQNKNNKISILTADFSKIYLDYYHVINYRKEREIKMNNNVKIRNSITFVELGDIFNKKKTEVSIIANITQGLDALFLRLIMEDLNYPIITIHDSFGIDILNIDHLIKVANVAINKIHYCFESDFNKFEHFKLTNYYSIYILI